PSPASWRWRQRMRSWLCVLLIGCHGAAEAPSELQQASISVGTNYWVGDTVYATFDHMTGADWDAIYFKPLSGPGVPGNYCGEVLWEFCGHQGVGENQGTVYWEAAPAGDYTVNAVFDFWNNHDCTPVYQTSLHVEPATTTTLEVDKPCYVSG